jgi:hypothetical protein
MDAHQLPDDLSALERRLAAWQPDAEGLDLAGALYAAGRAAVRPRPTRFVWPAIAAGLALAAAALGGWAMTERAGRMALARQLQAGSAPIYYAKTPTAPGAPAEEVAAPNSYLAAHRALQKGLDAWPAMSVSLAKMPKGPSLPHSPVLHVGQLEIVLKHERLN